MSAKNNPQVSIIISNHNGKDFLAECLQYLTKLEYQNFEVIVVDAGSTDGAPELVKEYLTTIHNLRLLQYGLIGIGEAINKGIVAARGDIIIIDLNSDEDVAPDWLTKLVNLLLSSTDIGIVSGVRLSYGTDTVQSAGGTISFFGRVTYFGEGKKTSQLPKNPFEVDYVPLIGFRKSLLDEIGYCNEDYQIYVEDVEFCLRAKRAGYRIVVEPTALAYHRGSATLGNSPRKLFFERRNLLTMYFTHFPIYRAMFAFSWVVAQTGFEAMLMLPFFKKGVSNTKYAFLNNRTSPEHIRAAMSAIIWNLTNLKKVFQVRSFENSKLGKKKREKALS